MSESKRPVIVNIRHYAAIGELNHKVEVGDPHFTPEQSAAAIKKFYRLRKSPLFPLRRHLAYKIAEKAAADFMRNFEIVDDTDPAAPVIVGENLRASNFATSGAIITSNHFNPMDTLLPREFAKRCGKKLYIVSQDTNLALPHPLDFITNHTDLIPLPASPNAIAKVFKPHLEAAIRTKDFVLIYPEEEMWYNYRKPRPPKPGAYRFAAELHAPIISCFTEMLDTKEPEILKQSDSQPRPTASPEFNRVEFRLHILGILTPDNNKSPRENAKILSEQDYALKTSAYERIYGESLNYNFSQKDIAGWRG